MAGNKFGNKFGKKNKRRALNKYLHISHKSNFPLINKDEGLGKYPRFINVGPKVLFISCSICMSIPLKIYL